MPRQPQAPRENRFSQRLNRLFETRFAPTDPSRPYTLTEVADATGLTIGYLSKARLGSIAYPGPDKLRALATFFEVHVDYFTQEREEAADAALVTPTVLATLRKPGMSALLRRAGKLGPDELRLVDDFVTYLDRRLRRHKGPEGATSDPINEVEGAE